MAESTWSDVRLLVPQPDEEPWPTLGGQVAEWIEEHLVHGPGDVLGLPVVLPEEFVLFLYRAYEVYPHGHPQAGRRRFKRVVLSRRKGVAKTELGAFLSIAEMDPTAPVRTVDWRKTRSGWEPIGGPIRDPYIPIVAYTEDQAADLGYWAVHEILGHSDIGNGYDIGLERIMHRTSPGVMKALATAPSARDGARTSFQWFDESHLFFGDRHRRTHQTMLRNIPKRDRADAWTLETTTMYDPGEYSIAQTAHEYALDVAAGRVKDSRLLFDHRQASVSNKITTKRGLRAAIVEASGDAISYTDVESVIAHFEDPDTDESEFRRYWLNQRTKSSRRWVSHDLVRQRMHALPKLLPDADVVLAFDGSYNRDSTALVACTIEPRPRIYVVGKWLKPADATTSWRVSRNDVDERLRWAMEEYHVREVAPDPHGWGREIEDWELAFGETIVMFNTDQPSRMGPACDDFEQGLRDDEFDLELDEDLLAHFDHCVPVKRRGYDVVTKSSPDSPDKIDLAVGAIVAYHRARWHFFNDEEEEMAFIFDPMTGAVR